jgi:membrane-bound inhibitor of C-type lysozyme/uncharacterized membrane protein
LGGLNWGTGASRLDLLAAGGVAFALLTSAAQGGERGSALAHLVHPAARTFVYECADGFGFVARIEGETAWLFLPRKTQSLPHVESGSGAKYSDGAVTYWGKGEEALLETGDEVHRGCRNNRAKAIWEQAKLDGVDFRAVGNEPGWFLEIRWRHRIVFVGDYGQSRYEFPAPEPQVDQAARKTLLSTRDGGHELVVELRGRPCHDSMSGEPFETTVTVRLDGKTYPGCGRALH